MAFSLIPRFGSFFDDMNLFTSGPSVHSWESNDTLFLELELPRFRAQDIQVQAREGILEITGQLPRESQGDQQFLYGASRLSNFRRAIEIPWGFDGSKMRYTMENGVLTVTIPRKPVQQPVPLPVTRPAAPSRELTSTTTTDDKGQIVKSTGGSVQEFKAVSHMKWPPHIQVDDSNDQLKYTCTMPNTVPAECVELSLDGNHLLLGVHHTRQLTKQDQKGATVFDEAQSVQYTTSLRVPEGTVAGDVSTKFDAGNLLITVSKHTQNGAQKDIQVTPDPKKA